MPTIDIAGRALAYERTGLGAGAPPLLLIRERALRASFAINVSPGFQTDAHCAAFREAAASVRAPLETARTVRLLTTHARV